VLTTLEGEDAITAAKQALAQGTENRDIIEMVTTIMVYKFTQLTRAEVDEMLGVTLQETRVYQDALAEGEIIGEAKGEAKGKLEMVVMILTRRLGDLPESTIDRLSQLSIKQVEALGIASFDFQNLADLTTWLSN
jgi:predicted transposase YdaD